MPCTCVVGLQWGDEAKGKIVDLLGGEQDIVARYNGGANAGHTIAHGGQTFKLSLLPTGVLRPGVRAVIGNGVVIDPTKLWAEVEQLRTKGVDIGDRLAVSAHAHVIFPYHVDEDELNEAGSVGAIGTTRRGVGPCYQDKLNRTCGVRVTDLLDPAALCEKLATILPRKEKMLSALAGKAMRYSADQLTRDYLAHGERLRPMVRDTGHLLREAVRRDERVLFEAAQGSLLDVDHGTYPYVTSSNSSPAGIWSGAGVPARCLTRIVGVVKAYCSRVGRGPFPTELHDDLGETIRQTGREFGTVTGRPRRVGWFDAVAARYSAALGGVDEIAVMLLDVLSVVPDVKICTAYELHGERTDLFPADARLLEQCRPVYETLPGWDADLTGCRKLSELPAAARRYVDRLAELLGARVSVVSVGPAREQSILT